MQAYSDPKREDEEYALPDVEIFYMSAEDFLTADPDTWMADAIREGTGSALCAAELAGWYWWSCFPGCLPDSEPTGPFATEQDALDDAREGNET